MATLEFHVSWLGLHRFPESQALPIPSTTAEVVGFHDQASPFSTVSDPPPIAHYCDMHVEHQSSEHVLHPLNTTIMTNMSFAKGKGFMLSLIRDKVGHGEDYNVVTTSPPYR